MNFIQINEKKERKEKKKRGKGKKKKNEPSCVSRDYRLISYGITD